MLILLLLNIFIVEAITNLYGVANAIYEQKYLLILIQMPLNWDLDCIPQFKILHTWPSEKPSAMKWNVADKSLLNTIWSFWMETLRLYTKIGFAEKKLMMRNAKPLFYVCHISYIWPSKYLNKCTKLVMQYLCNEP